MAISFFVERNRQNPDGLSYQAPDSGCQAATEFLHHQSSCLDCPFSQCLMELGRIGGGLKKHLRNAEIRRRRAEGATITSLCKELQVSKRTVKRVLRGEP